ncbi:pyridoxal kinase PdxY [Methylocapsa sp. S129]|uniref:pyridoxal kinase PdxY n=1 Tax=Methylocapsa sp. S129 TaxID=1641869 RepID=UPI00131AC397|nr:pyridoxal kinase PdxY [Methylocapsa sp. S129]
MPHSPPVSILSIQSHVVYGHVGNSAAAFPLQRIGCEVWPINTVQFSNHTGYPDFRGQVFDAAMIDDCVTGVAARGALARCNGVLSGYMGSPEIGAAILRGVGAVRDQNAEAVYCCDPVLGDVGRGIFVREGVVEFMRERALPAATILTPNHFELDLLSNLPSTDMSGARAALGALHERGPRVILVTSLALDDTPADAIDMVVSENGALWRLRTPKAPIKVNGAGDVIAALFLAHWLRTHSASEAIALAASSVYGLVAATAKAGSQELEIIAAQEEFIRPSRLFVAERI